MIQAGPEWVEGNPGHFVLAGREIEGWHGSYRELDADDLAKSLIGRRVVATRLDDETAFIRLDDGTHIGFRSRGGQGENWIDVLAWDDDPPQSSKA